MQSASDNHTHPYAHAAVLLQLCKRTNACKLYCMHTRPDHRICSSLALQQLLYYNVFWSIAWLVTHCLRVGMRVSGRAC